MALFLTHKIICLWVLYWSWFPFSFPNSEFAWQSLAFCNNSSLGQKDVLLDEILPVIWEVGCDMEKLNPKRIPLRDSPAQGDPSKGINWSEPGLCKCCPWDVTAAFYCNSHQERLDFNYTHNKTAIWTEMVAAPIVFTE